MISVVYGLDQNGQLALNFGPLNREGGARRLNVAITRARRKLILVSSLEARDLEGAASAAVGHLRQYLDFAQRGSAVLRTDHDARAGGQAAPGLEMEVQAELARLGYASVPQVG